MTITMGQDYSTRDGRDVRILATDLKGDYPVCFAVYLADNRVAVRVCLSSGRQCLGFESPNDIIERPKRFKFERWAGIFKDRNGNCGILFMRDSEQQAREAASIFGSVLAVKKMTIEGTEGEGL